MNLLLSLVKTAKSSFASLLAVIFHHFTSARILYVCINKTLTQLQSIPNGSWFRLVIYLNNII